MYYNDIQPGFKVFMHNSKFSYFSIFAPKLLMDKGLNRHEIPIQDLRITSLFIYKL